jgi:hypothetical protein
MGERLRTSRPYLFGAALVLVGFVAGKLPTWLVRSEVLSLYEIAHREAPLLHLTDGCQGSKAAAHSYVSDAALAAAVIPVVRPSASGEHGRFEQIVCDLSREALAQRVWWTRLVERVRVGTRRVWRGLSPR